MTKSKKSSSCAVIDLTLRDGDVGYDVLNKCPSVTGRKEVSSQEKSLDSHSSATSTAAATRKAHIATMKRSKAMQIATGPGKQILMNAFMMYMSGKQLNIFSISTTSMALMTPLMGLFNINNTFRPFQDADGKVDLQMPKLLFVLLNLVWFGVGLYKMGSMKLLPTTSADWTGTIVWKEMMEISSIPPISNQ
mmetsp:Transcript_26659/g.40902  ORF Transcript_26659/g.40902 Transcript_26659/m.40902 type:complete len:192 (+) Transcript_26659:19-594(+)